MKYIHHIAGTVFWIIFYIMGRKLFGYDHAEAGISAALVVIATDIWDIRKKLDEIKS